MDGTGHSGPNSQRLQTFYPQASEVLKSLRQLEGGQQLTVLQDIVVNMGFETARMTPTLSSP